VAGDAAEQLVRRLDHHAILAGEVARPQDLERVIRERRRHARTVRSAARARNRPHGRLALVLLAALAVLAILAARAAAAPASAAPQTTYDDITPTDDSDSPDADPGGEPHAPLRADPDTPATTPARTGPDVREVIAAAIRAAGLAGDPARGWRARSRLSALIPQIGFRIGQNESWREIDDPTLSHVLMFDVRASWRLDALVFSSTELRIASLDVLRRRERRRLAWYVISLYRAWRRTGNDDLAAQLDVVTDGWFSEHLSNPPESHQ
jgi:hypothetical protein